MMFTFDTVCGRTIQERPKNVLHFWWGEAAMCCGHCRTIAESRASWEVFA